jgi:hypothetical protein
VSALPADRSVRGLLVRVAARAEQEVRAYPRLHDAFYRTVNRSPRLRSWAGRTKDRVRGVPGGERRPRTQQEPEVVAARRAAVATRLGLPGPPA